MALQNRVLPDGKIVAQSWRGMFMGNKGGRIHDPETKTLLNRRWVSKRWITCVTEFKNRKRNVMGKSYTELFFLDEVSALSSGHRPCFECRRKDANAFAEAWVKVHGESGEGMADRIDAKLHDDRLKPKSDVTLNKALELPDGTMFSIHDNFYAKKGEALFCWSGSGYDLAMPKVDRLRLITPLSTIAALQEGYKPHWHPSIDHGSENGSA